mmetsp:Transcript_12446/g.18683  ORF Transcript_12446/g.18683 Transcript_12446/m.18683 type:complete len:282 (-) Transcript_12446:37-882(-)
MHQQLARQADFLCGNRFCISLRVNFQQFQRTGSRLFRKFILFAFRCYFSETSKSVPKFLVFWVLVYKNHICFASSVIILNRSDGFYAFCFLGHACFFPKEQEQLQTEIQNKHIPNIQTGILNGQLFDSSYTLSFDLKQTWPVLVSNDFGEATRYASRKILNVRVLEITHELTALVSFNFTELNGAPSQSFVQLDGFVGGDAILVLGALGPQPKVQVPLEPGPVLDGRQQQIAVALVKFPVALRLLHYFFVFDSEELQAGALAAVLEYFVDLSHFDQMRRIR